MPRIKLTEKAVKSLAAPTSTGKEIIYWDADLKGFGLKCSGKTNTRTYIVQRDLADGRTRRLTVGEVGPALSVEKARLEAHEMILDLRRGKDPKARKKEQETFEGWLGRYLDGNTRLSPNTAEHYRSVVELHLEDWLELPLPSITPDMVEAKHRSIARAIAARNRKVKEGSAVFSGQATANSAMRIFRIIWNFAADSIPDLPRNPTARLKRHWFPSPRRERMVKADQLPVFYKSVSCLQNQVARDYLLLLLFTGLRRSEAASLRWTDIDFPNKVIRVPAIQTKAKRKLDLPMSDIVRDILVVRRRFAGDSAFVFPAFSESGHIMEPKFPLREVEKETGIAISAHDLRRTYITIAESTEISPLALKALVNHALGNDVTSGYIQITTDRLREPAQRVADRLKLLCKIREKSRKVAA